MGRVFGLLRCGMACALCLGMAACERPSADFEPEQAVLGAVAGAERRLGVTADAVSSRSTGGEWRSVLELPADAPSGQRVELAPDANHFGVYREGGLVVYAADGTRLSRFDPLPLGYRHKLIGEGLLLSPIVEQTGAHDGRVLGLLLRDALQRTVTRIDADSIRFTRASQGAITLATGKQISRYGTDGRLHWTVGSAAHELAVARSADRVAVIDAEDTRRITHFAGGRSVGVAEFRAPLWNAALSSDGRYSAATTQTRLHLFDEGRLRHNIELDAAHATSLAVADDGRVLVGAQDAMHRGRVFCYDRHGELLHSLTLPVDDHAFRPAVGFLPDGRYLVRTQDAVREGECRPGGAP